MSGAVSAADALDINDGLVEAAAQRGRIYSPEEENVPAINLRVAASELINADICSRLQVDLHQPNARRNLATFHENPQQEAGKRNISPRNQRETSL